MDKKVEALEEGLMEYITETSRLTNFRGPTPLPEALKPDSKATAQEKIEANEEYTAAILAKAPSQLTPAEYEDLAESLRTYLRSQR